MYITASSNYSVDNYYFGLFELNGYGSECFEYSDAGYDEDGALKAGQAFAVLTALIGSFLLISIFLEISYLVMESYFNLRVCHCRIRHFVSQCNGI